MQHLFARYPGTSWRLVLFALTIPLVVVSAVFIWQDYQSRRDAITTQVQLQAAQVNAQLEDFVHTVESVSGQFSTHWAMMYPDGEVEPDVQGPQTSFLKATVAFGPHFSLASITDLSGDVLVSSDPSQVGQRIGPESLYRQARATNSFTVSDVVYPSEESAPVALFVTPLTYDSAEPGGFLVLQSGLDAISSSMDMSGVAFPRTGKSGIFDSQGRILAGTGYDEPHPGLFAGGDISGSRLWAQAVTRPESCWFGPAWTTWTGLSFSNIQTPPPGSQP